MSSGRIIYPHNVPAPIQVSGSPAVFEQASRQYFSAPLFRELQIGSLTLDNRIVMAPMTRSFAPGGIPGADMAAYYRRRVEGGVGLIITEGVFIDHATAGFSPRIPRLADHTAAGWRGVIDAVHDVGGRIMPQLWHVGPLSLREDDPHPDIPLLSPSGFSHPGQRIGEAMTVQQIEDVIEGFGRSAAQAMHLGFDGVQLHGAMGCLIDAFLWDKLNHRNDDYGGDMKRRGRFASEVVRECRRRTAPDFPVYFRFSQWKKQDFTAKLAETPAELAAVLEPLVDAGVDMFDAATRRFWEPEFPDSALNLAGWTKKLTGKTTSAVGSVSLIRDFFENTDETIPVATANVFRLLEMLARDDFDLVAIGRALISDPEWPRKIYRGDIDRLVPFDKRALETLS